MIIINNCNFNLIIVMINIDENIKISL